MLKREHRNAILIPTTGLGLCMALVPSTADLSGFGGMMKRIPNVLQQLIMKRKGQNWMKKHLISTRLNV